MKKSIELTEENENIITAVLNLAQITADAQIDDLAKQDAYDIIEALADLCDIPKTTVKIEETHNDDGSVDVHIEAQPEPTKPTLTLISDNTREHD